MTFLPSELENAPVVSCHSRPQRSPQEWECGCVTGVYVTDRDARDGERPFEMRLAHACGTDRCELAGIGIGIEREGHNA